MARYSQLDAARLRRDLGLARARRLTVYAAVGATGLTAVITLVAATSIPGRSAAAAPANPGGNGITTGTQPGVTQPITLPQNGNGGVPVVVSGGS